MKIAACLICKDDSELPKLRKAIASIYEHVDSIYITATGEETSIIKAYCEANKEYGLHYSFMTPKTHPEVYTKMPFTPLSKDDFYKSLGINVKNKKELDEYNKNAPEDERRINYSTYLKQFDVSRGGKYEFSNFSAARNFNFSQVPQDTDWIFWMDSDDVLIGGEHLRHVAQVAKDSGKDLVFLTYWYGCEFNGEPSVKTFKKVLMEQNRERLIRPGTVVWKKRLHETPLPVTGAKNVYTKYLYEPNERPIVVMHTTEDKDLPEKMLRNKRLLEMELRDEQMLPGGADPRTLLYLMKIYAEQDEEANWPKVLEMGKEYLTKSGWNEERATCLEQMGIVLGKQGDFVASAEHFHKAIAEWPNQPLIYIRLATAYYNLKNYGFAEHWAKLGANLDIDNGGSNLTNLAALKLMYSELLVKLNWNARRDTKKALEAAKLLFQEAPTKENAEQVEFIENFDKLNDACRNVDQLCQYMDLTDYQDAIVPVLDALPGGITEMPFAQKIRQQFTKPRRWAENEICYFANFGSAHFEKWDMSNLKTGIGGSETAALELAKEWTKMGYKVTVYSDPLTKGEQEGVTILPWYYFNHRDSFNIFIQWRSPALAGKIKVKKFFVDLHDIMNIVDFQDKLEQVDAVLAKSEYHKSLIPKEMQAKFKVIGNGVSL